MYEAIQVGSPFRHLEGKPEGVVFEIDQTGPMLIFHYDNPSELEKKQFLPGTTAEFRFVRVDGVLFFLAKVGDFPWVDAPYSLQLSDSALLLDAPEGQGYGLMLLLVNRTNSIVEAIRLVGLSQSFSNDLKNEILKDVGTPLVAPMYYAHIRSIYQKYTTKQLVRMAKKYYKLR